MGDVQEYFINKKVRNFYSVSISGYHIAEAGANPITQLAFTLSNGFTYVEYYLSRGMSIDDFGPNLSFFFSNGIDPEYAVIGRVARRIWAKAMKFKYGAHERAQKLKYHIQTSGRSLHAQEIDAIRDVKKQYRRNHNLWDAKGEDIPVYGTIASQFNDLGMNNLYKHLIDLINKSSKTDFSSSFKSNKELSEKVFIIPPNRVRYLSKIAENNREFDKRLNHQVVLADKLYVFCKALKEFSRDNNNIVNSILEQKN